MAEEIIYNIRANAQDAEKSIGALNKSLSDTSNSAKKTSKDIDKLGDNTKDAGEKGGKGLSIFRQGINKIGIALKAAGIGLLLSALTAVFSVLKQNQKFIDAFNTTMNALSIATNDFINYVLDNFDEVGEKTKSVFTDPIGSIENFGKALKENIQDKIDSLIKRFVDFGDGFVKIFQGDIKGAMNSFSESFKDVILSQVPFGESIKKNLKAVSDYAKETIKSANNLTKLGKASEVAAAQQQQLIEKNDILAETQRQIRDDESLSIEVRKKANEKLGEILEKQGNDMKKLAKIQQDKAQADFDLNKSDANRIALINAKTNSLAVEAQVTGFLSEQKVNQVALLKEERELTNSLGESQARLLIEKQKAEANLLVIDQDRINRLIEINAMEKDIEAERLQAIIDNENAGTQAKIDAKIALDEFLAANSQEQAQLKRELQDQEIADEQAVAEAKMAVQDEYLNHTQTLSNLFGALAGKNKALATAGLVLEKGAAIAKVIIDTQKANAAILTASGVEASGYKVAAAANALNPAAAGAFTALAAKATLAGKARVLKNNVMSGVTIASIAATALGRGNAPSAGGGVGGSEATPRSPQFNLVGQTPATTGGNADNANAQIENNNNNPVRAYVVSTDVSSQQALDRDIEDDNTLG